MNVLRTFFICMYFLICIAVFLYRLLTCSMFNMKLNTDQWVRQMYFCLKSFTVEHQQSWEHRSWWDAACQTLWGQTNMKQRSVFFTSAVHLHLIAWQCVIFFLFFAPSSSPPVIVTWCPAEHSSSPPRALSSARCWGWRTIGGLLIDSCFCLWTLCQAALPSNTSLSFSIPALCNCFVFVVFTHRTDRSTPALYAHVMSDWMCFFTSASSRCWTGCRGLAPIRTHGCGVMRSSSSQWLQVTAHTTVSKYIEPISNIFIHGC